MNPLYKKLKLQPNQTVVVINKPEGFEKSMGKLLPAGVKFTVVPSVPADHIYWFVKNVAEVQLQQAAILKLLKQGNRLWILHPKGSSKIQTDLTRDRGWDSLMAVPNLTWVSYISFDDTWTAIGLRRQTEEDQKRIAKPTEQREIYKYANSESKTITLPEDLDKTLKANKKAMQVFDALTFSNRREYVEWVITAKREETRKARLEGTIEKLLAGRKNPAGR